jgi:hypothetical protein
MRDQFCQKLDAQDLGPCDMLIVLRNHDPQLNKERVDVGVKLLLSNLAPIMLMTYDTNTLTEAQRIYSIWLRHPTWRSMVLVTHKAHHYRAYLTFAKVFRLLSPDIYTFPIDSALESEEFDKIERYSQKGDIATYEEGLRWL